MTPDGLTSAALSEADIAAERAVLGSVIQFPGAAEEAAATLRPEHFGIAAHRIVFEAVQRMSDAGQLIDPATVLDELTRAGMLTKVGAPDAGTGGAYLHTLMQSWGSIPVHAAHILAAWRIRNLRSSLLSAMQVAGDPAFDPDTHYDHIRKLIDDATSAPAGIDKLQSGIDPGLPTGLSDLDDAIGGMRPGELIVIGARTSVGKSLLALTMAENIAGPMQLPVLLTSLEMSDEEVAHRRMASLASVPLERFTRHTLTDSDWDRVARCHGKLTGSRLLIDDTPEASLASIRSQLRAMERAGEPARLHIIDYLGLMKEPKAESRQAAIAALSRGAKRIAREFRIPVIAVVQVNRAPEGRSDKRPVMSDLRESGAIEADADMVLLLHRDDYYEPDHPRAGEIDVIVAKQRQGPRTTVALSFQGHYGRIADLEWRASAAADRSPVGGAA